MASCIQPIETRTLVAQSAGSATAIWPRLELLQTPQGEPAFLQFSQSYALVGVGLSSSIVAFGTNRAGLLLVIGQRQLVLTVSPAIYSPISHVTAPNSLTGPPAVAIPTSKVTSLSFGAYGIAIPSATPVSLYGFLDDSAGNDLFAICSLHLVAVR